MLNSEQRILSKPCDVNFAGWQSDTVRLQYNGWKIAVDFRPSTMEYGMILHHDYLRLYAMCLAEHIEPNYANLSYAGRDARPSFTVSAVAPTIQFLRDKHVELNYKQINAQPRLVENKITSIEDLNIFDVCKYEAEAIYIDKADMSVVEHLAAIKELQEPKQKELREKATYDSTKQRSVEPEVVSQIIRVS